MISRRWAIGGGITCLVATCAMLAVRPDALAQSNARQKNEVKISPMSPPGRSRPFIRDWKEKNAPKCFPVAQFNGLMINERDSIDFFLRDGRVIRGKLKKGCSSASFYSGLYIHHGGDRKVCEDRDRLQSRTGGGCQIAKFKILRPNK